MRLIANSRPGSAATTVGQLGHVPPCSRLIARKRAPTAGPVAPRTHMQRMISGDSSDVRVTSETMP